MHFLGRLEILKQLAGYQLLGTNFSGLEIAPREVILKFVDFHWLHAVGNARLEWPYRKRALSLPQENGWHFAGLREQINNLARHFQRRTAFPASPACRLLTSPGAGGLLQPGENGKYLRGGGGGGGYTGPAGRHPPPRQRPGRQAQRPGREAQRPRREAGAGPSNGRGCAPPPPPNATGWRGGRWASEPSWRLGGGKRPPTPNSFCWGFYPQPSEQLKQLQRCDQELTSHSKNGR